MNELKEIYLEIKDKVDKQLKKFDYLRYKGSKEELFEELVFCLLTPQSKARMAEKTIIKLKKKNLLFSSATPEILAMEFNLVRFKNHKASYVYEAQQKFLVKNQLNFDNILDFSSSTHEKRNWLVTNIKGMGLKEASHFLRNIGYYKDIAILDRHILKNMAFYRKIEKTPTLNLKNYLLLEKLMKEWAFQLDIPFEYLDFVLWFKETMDIFK